MSIVPFLIEIFTIIIAHAVVGIYSSDLKYSKKNVYKELSNEETKEMLDLADN